MKTKAGRHSPILSALLVYVPVALLAVDPLFGHRMSITTIVLMGLILGGTIITLLRIIKLIGKEWLSPIIAALLISPLIIYFLVCCAIGFGLAFT
ncbi:MAG: hypothetical protein AAF065_15385 [Verrucomicrobiota bacterium]